MNQLSSIPLALEKIAGPLPLKLGNREATLEITSESKEADLKRVSFLLKTPDGDTVPGGCVFHSKEKVKGIAACFHRSMDQREIGHKEPLGLKGIYDLQHGAHLAALGYFSFCLDYPNFGSYSPKTYELGWKSQTRKNIENYNWFLEAANYTFDLGYNLPVISIGHSMGGSNAVFFAVFCESVKAVIASCGVTTFKSFADTIGGGNLDRWALPEKYMPIIKSEFNSNPALMPVDFPFIIASLAPRFVFINAPINDPYFSANGAKQCEEVARAEYERLGVISNLNFHYPAGEHEFSSASREHAYKLLRANDN